MSMKATYLEKYSIAPSPSRDYYGLRVLEDKIILFHWRISHGPHKTPLTQISTYIDWKNDQLLQGEIGRIFGNSLLQYTNDIVLNRRTLLTLPKKLIKKLFGYISINDIVKLFSLSRAAYQILNTEFVYELFYRRIKSDSWTIADEKFGMAYGWKQLFYDTKDIEAYHGLNNKWKTKRSNIAMKPQLKTPSLKKPPSKPQLEIIRTMSAGTKSPLANEKSKVNSSIGNNNLIIKNVNKKVYSSNQFSGGMNSKAPKFLNIVNLEADNINLQQNTKDTANICKKDVSKTNILGKPPISKSSLAPKLSSSVIKTKNESIGVFKSPTLRPKYNFIADSLASKIDNMSLDDLVKNTIEKLHKPNGIFDCKLNSFNDITSSFEDESIGDDTSTKYDKSFLTNKYKTAKNTVYDTSKLSSNAKSTVNALSIDKKIHELSGWHVAKIKALKSAEALQSLTSTKRNITSISPKYVSRFQKNT